MSVGPRLVLAAALILLALPSTARASVGTTPSACVATSVGVSAGTISADLCQAATDDQSTLLVTVAGATYGRIYWDLSYEPSTYSFVNAMTAAGHDVLNLDRLGTGKSSHPVGLAVTQDAGAQAIHDVVTAARAGALGHRYARVILVAHSLGSGIAETEASTYHDVDGLIVTGLVHKLSVAKVGSAVSTFYPASLDPRFAGKGLDPSYLTTRPGIRAGSFYYAPNADPAVIAMDEAAKETITAGEAATFYTLITPGVLDRPVTCSLLAPACAAAPSVLSGPTPGINVPVLMVVGSQDALMCGQGATDCTSDASLRAAEAPYWSAAPCFSARVVPDAGHDLNLQRNAQDWYALADTWLGRIDGGSCPAE